MKESEARKNICSLFKDKKILSLKHVQGIIFHKKRPVQEQNFYEGILNKLITEGLLTIFIGDNGQHYYKRLGQENKKTKFKNIKRDNRRIEREW